MYGPVAAGRDTSAWRAGRPPATLGSESRPHVIAQSLSALECGTTATAPHRQRPRPPRGRTMKHFTMKKPKTRTFIFTSRKVGGRPAALASFSMRRGWVGGGWRAAAMFVLNRTVWVADSDSPLGSSVRGLRQAFNFYEGRRSSAVAHGSPYAFLDFLPFVSRFLSLRIGFENRFDRLDYGRFLAGELRRQWEEGRGGVIRDVRMCAHAACTRVVDACLSTPHAVRVCRSSLSVVFPRFPIVPFPCLPVFSFPRFPVSPSHWSSCRARRHRTFRRRSPPTHVLLRAVIPTVTVHTHTHTVTVTTATTTADICRTLDV